jgi:hypothetical protein
MCLAPGVSMPAGRDAAPVTFSRGVLGASVAGVVATRKEIARFVRHLESSGMAGRKAGRQDV